MRKDVADFVYGKAVLHYVLQNEAVMGIDETVNRGLANGQWIGRPHVQDSCGGLRKDRQSNCHKQYGE
ncbi:MAG: hypothetical protein IJQ94_05245 [Bacteroidales bacterium]|nr:hypothetical protein [Bacteroidales bacterium]